MQLASGKDITVTELSKLMDLIPTKSEHGNYLKMGAKTELKDLSGLKGGDAVNLQDLPALGFEPLALRFINKDGVLSLLKLENADRAYFGKLIRRYGYGVLNAEPSVILSTIHGVKGREADTVILNTNLTHRTYDAMINSPEPEHRLYYVGVTRAKTKLIILDPEDWECYRI